LRNKATQAAEVNLACTVRPWACSLLNYSSKALFLCLPTLLQYPGWQPLPQENLVPRSAKFFHQKLSLDNLLWLGDENILNLGEQTNAVLAVDTYGDVKAQLLVVEYPHAAMAEAAHAALEGSGLENLAAAGQGNQYLVAVFEKPDYVIAQGRLQKALEKLTD
jgi:hypothetical protein